MLNHQSELAFCLVGGVVLLLLPHGLRPLSPDSEQQSLTRLDDLHGTVDELMAVEELDDSRVVALVRLRTMLSRSSSSSARTWAARIAPRMSRLARAPFPHGPRTSAAASSRTKPKCTIICGGTC